LENDNLDDNLAQLAEMTAKILSAINCSIMLLNDGTADNLLMSVCAHYGPMPAAAYKELIGKGDGIAGHVIATGQPLLIEDINCSAFAKLARRANEPCKSLISSPITIGGQIVGVVNVSGHMRDCAFNLVDLNLLNVVALFIGKSIQSIQLQSILNSRLPNWHWSKKPKIIWTHLWVMFFTTLIKWRKYMQNPFTKKWPGEDLAQIRLLVPLRKLSAN
jgi:L-methionine (R)-S-oxide reductase